MLLLSVSQHKERPIKTLIVAKPSNILIPWVNEITNPDNFGRSFSLYVHHSSMGVSFKDKKEEKMKTRIKDSQKFKDYDFVITTYNTLSSEWKKGKSPIHSVFWERIILDEATAIKNSTTLVARTVRDLNGLYRYCLTGT